MFQATLVVAVGLFLASCKKDWTCECTAGDFSHKSTIHDEKLKDAQDQCDSEGSVLGVDYECDIKVLD